MHSLDCIVTGDEKLNFFVIGGAERSWADLPNCVTAKQNHAA